MHTPTVLVLDPDTAGIARSVGLHVTNEAPTADLLRAVDAVIVGPTQLETLRTWRIAGHGVAAVVLGPAPKTPEPYQPATFTDVRGLREAVDRIASQRALRTVRLHRGIADLERLVFHPDSGDDVRLTQREAHLLAHLARNVDREVSRAEVQTEVFGHRAAVQTRAVDMAVSRLRKKVERDPRNPESLLTARGGGYRLAPLHLAPAGLYGRTAELSRLSNELGPGALVTLKGPPGVGKTRLAEALLVGREGHLVRLESLRPPGLRVGIAAQLDLDLASEPEDLAPERAIASALDPSRLLVLDNAEHVHGALSDLVARIRRDLPELSILVTSQVALGLDDERIVELGPLTQDAARQLFLSGTDTPPDEAVLSDVLQALDGLPLAIELASRWGEAVPWTEVPALLASHEPAVTGQLQAAVGLLAPRQREALLQLGTFQGAFAFADVVAVLPAPGAADLKRLVDASLVHREGDRYRLLAPVRRYAQAQTGGPARHTTHHLHMCQVARDLVTALPTADAVSARKELAERFADLQAAWQHRHEGFLALALDAVHASHGRPDDRRTVLQTAWQHCEEPDVRVRIALQRTFVHPAQELARLSDDLEALIPLVRDPVLRVQMVLELAWIRYRRESDLEPSLRARDLAQAEGTLAQERMAQFLVSMQSVRNDPAGLAAALPRWESIAQDLEGLQDYPNALRVANCVASTWSSLGDPGRASLALATLERLLTVFPDGYHEGTLFNLRAFEHLDNGDFEAALASLETMRRVRFGRTGVPDAVWQRTRAIVLLDLGRHAEALRDLEGAIERLASIPHIQQLTIALCALGYAEQGEVGRGLDLLTTRVDVADSTGVARSYALESLAMLHALNGDVDAAEAIHRDHDPDSLGPESAAVMWAVRGVLGDASSLERARAHEGHTVTARSLAALLRVVDDPGATRAFETPPNPMLVRVVARIRRCREDRRASAERDREGP